MQIFVADDKFGDVIAALEARGGWRRHAHLSFPRPALRWTNYARVPWPRVQPEQLVNHLQHAVLFSQKDRLAALLAAYQGKAEVAGDAGAVVDAFYPRTFDLRRPTAWRELRQWAVYSEAVAVLKRFQRRGEEADPTVVRCAVAFIQAVLRDDDFFKRTRGVDSHLNAEDDEGVAVMEPTPRESTPRSSADYVHVDAAEWRLLSSRWVADAPAVEEHPPLDEAVVSREAVADLLEQLAARDPQLSAVSDASGEGEEGGCVWICKPSNLSQGRGITLVRSLDDLAAVVSPSQDDEAGAPDASGQPKAAQQWVVQKYVERPLLCQGGRKFDIRQWVLVTALPPAVQVFWYRDCYLRFCSRPFSLGTASSRQDRFAHLSNYSVQKDFVADEDRRGEAPPSFESMWSSERFRDSLRFDKCRRAVLAMD